MSVSEARDVRERLSRGLAEMRERTLALVAPLSDADITTQHDPKQSPVTWDLGHIANFEEQWLVQRLTGNPPLHEGFQDVYDAIRNPRPTRRELPLLGRREVLDYMGAVRSRTLKVLEAADLGADDPLLRDAFVYDMVLQHEAQHQETILITLQMLPAGRYVPGVRREKPQRVRPVPEGMVRVPGGPIPQGTSRSARTYDNEWPQHEVDVAPFWIDRAPVTNGEFLRFVKAGGYERSELWDEDGWMVRQALSWDRPLSWETDGSGAWRTREMDRVVPLPVDQPVIHVSWFEADAYARWAGKRLPTEAEWETAATWDARTGAKRHVPWGGAWAPALANLDHTRFGPAAVGTGLADTPCGCVGMFGDAWEWTASEFTRYPGFEHFPYPEYSEPFFDSGWYVLRGGSWATRPIVARGTFRNWATQEQRHIFAGIRCARDDGGGPA